MLGNKEHIIDLNNVAACETCSHRQIFFYMIYSSEEKKWKLMFGFPPKVTILFNNLIPVPFKDALPA